MCLESSLRVLINLSHDNATWCKLLHHELTIPIVMSLIATPEQGARPKIPTGKKIDDETGAGEYDAQAFDRLCLALGLLTNLVQAGDEAKDLCRETRTSYPTKLRKRALRLTHIHFPNPELAPSCPGNHTCARTCSCPGRISALECLVRVYLRYRKSEADEDDPGTHIVRGHLAVLFGLLMRECPANEAAVLAALPGTGRRVKLDALVRNAREFVGLYAEFMMRLSRGEEGSKEDGDEENDERRSSAERVVRDGAGDSVARDIVVFLEMLRDGINLLTPGSRSLRFVRLLNIHIFERLHYSIPIKNK